jgi:hypothetical protein
MLTKASGIRPEKKRNFRLDTTQLNMDDTDRLPVAWNLSG